MASWRIRGRYSPTEVVRGCPDAPVGAAVPEAGRDTRKRPKELLVDDLGAGATGVDVIAAGRSRSSVRPVRTVRSDPSGRWRCEDHSPPRLTVPTAPSGKTNHTGRLAGGTTGLSTKFERLPATSSTNPQPMWTKCRQPCGRASGRAPDLGHGEPVVAGATQVHGPLDAISRDGPAAGLEALVVDHLVATHDDRGEDRGEGQPNGRRQREATRPPRACPDPGGARFGAGARAPVSRCRDAPR